MSKEQLRLILHMEDVDEAKEELHKFFWRANLRYIDDFEELDCKIRRHKEYIPNTNPFEDEQYPIEESSRPI